MERVVFNCLFLYHIKQFFLHLQIIVRFQSALILILAQPQSLVDSQLKLLLIHPEWLLLLRVYGILLPVHTCTFARIADPSCVLKFVVWIDYAVLNQKCLLFLFFFDILNLVFDIDPLVPLKNFILEGRPHIGIKNWLLLRILFLKHC